MTPHRPSRMRRLLQCRSARNRQSGYVLLLLLIAMMLAIIALAAAAPRLATEVKREREEELIHRGKAYRRAIQLFFRKFGRYPASLDQLENTNNIRFLRRRFPDPITGKDEWRLIHAGEALAKPKASFVTGATPAGQMSGASPAGGNPFGGGAPSGIAGINPAAGGLGAGGLNGGPNSGPNGSPNMGGTLTNNPNSASGNFGSSAGSFGGGVPIVGVASTSSKEGIHEIDGKTHYNEWEFVYDPTTDRSGQRGGIVPGVGGSLGTGGPGVPSPQQQPNPPQPNPTQPR